jgi:hypothetical protein
VLEAGDIRNDLKWSAFGRWRRTAEHFLLYLGRTDAALHVPLRAFSAEQLAEFTRYLPRIGPS